MHGTPTSCFIFRTPTVPVGGSEPEVPEPQIIFMVPVGSDGTASTLHH
jgi:hypothetical protein